MAILSWRIKMSLGKRVKEYRVNNNMDQKEFAEKIDDN